MIFPRLFSKGSFAAFLILPALCVSPARSHAQTAAAPVFSTVASFAGGAGGAGPYGSLAQGPDGNFYGTTYLGGTGGVGTVFRLSAGGDITVLHSFAGSDGQFPQGGLILATDGFIYGTTYQGGASGDGTIFRVLPSDGSFVSVFSFTKGTTGANPYAGLTEINGVLYGTAVNGGSGGAGTLFSYPTGNSAAGLTVLHSFTGDRDGGNPEASPVSNGDGNLYGTAATGGLYQGGTVYVYVPGQGLATLHAFSLGEPTGPAANLVPVPGSNAFYGTTVSGGAADDGAIFRITATGTVSTVYSFSGGTDGANPQGTLVLGGDGTLYGTASMGGVLESGTVFSLSPAGIFTLLRGFTGDTSGGLPQSGLLVAADGSLYGTTYQGGSGTGALGNGTVYRLNFTGPAGVVAFTASLYNAIESAGTAQVTVSRVNGSAGTVSVDYATKDGTALAGIDYTAVTGTLTWADGDTADKTISVPVTDRAITDGSTRTVNLTLSNLRGGATAGQTLAAVLSIVDSDAQPTQPTAEFTSPPASVTQVVTGTPLTIAASINDPDKVLARVQFFVNGQLYAQTGSTGPFSVSLDAPAPGKYQLGATVLDTFGRTSTTTRTITVIAASVSKPAPTTQIVTDLDGRLLATGTTIILTADAASLSANGEPLAEVDFYADTQLIAAFDGAGHRLPITKSEHADDTIRPAAEVTPRDATATTAAGVFQTAFTMPNLNGLINLLTIAKAQSGRTQVSAPVTIKVTNSTDNKPPSAVLRDVKNGSRVDLGAKLTIPVTVSDPDAPKPIMAVNLTGGGGDERRTAAVTPPPGIIAQVAYYLDQLKVATSTAPPFSFTVAPTTAGTHVLEAIVTDGGGLSNVAKPVTIKVVAPSVSFRVGGGQLNHADVTEGSARIVRVERTGNTERPLTVTYKVKGANVPGVDYVRLSGKVTIPAGATSAKIKVRAINDGVADGDKVLRLELVAPANGSYTLGAPAKVSIRIIDAQ